MRLTFLAVPPVVPQGAVTLITVPLRPAGPSIGAGTLHTWVSWICYINSTSWASYYWDGAIIKYQLGKGKERNRERPYGVRERGQERVTHWNRNLMLGYVKEQSVSTLMLTLKHLVISTLFINVNWITFWIIPVKGFITPDALLVLSYSGTPPI